jgi:hypothetical protein
MTGFQDLESQLLDAIERKRSRRAHRASAIIVVASGGLVATLAVFAIVLLGNRKPSPPSTNHAAAASPPPRTQSNAQQATGGMQIIMRAPPGSQREVRDASAALIAVSKHDSACSPVQPPNPAGATISQGAPSAALLSVLPVLRRPASRGDRLPAVMYRHGRPLLLGEPSVAYVRYIRRARVVNGVAYYLVPGVIGSLPPTAQVLNRCYAKEMQLLRSRLAYATDSVRAATLGYGAKFFAATRAAAARQRPYDGVTELDWALHGNSGGGGGGAASAAAIEQEGMIGSSESAVYGVVPSDVATVTLEWPTNRTAATADVINNMFVVSAPGAGAAFPPPKIIWRAANGRVIKVVTNS